MRREDVLDVERGSDRRLILIEESTVWITFCEVAEANLYRVPIDVLVKIYEITEIRNH